MTVYLIGAGPGDPGLLTVRGQAILQTADVIIYDRLASDDLLLLAKDEALLFDAGKNPDGKKTSQDAINALLLEYGGAGKTVARLKGGDPFVFGRGGEELELCRGAGIPAEVIPGVSSAVAVPAYAGIPVTHRHVSTSFTVVTGHEAPDKDGSAIDYAALAKVETLVFLMAVKKLPQITAALLEQGRSADTPAAGIEWGTYRHQRVVRGTLGTIADIAADENLRSPTIFVFGDVVGLADTLAWYPGNALVGRRFALVEVDPALQTALIARGAWAVMTDHANDRRFDAVITANPELETPLMKIVVPEDIAEAVALVEQVCRDSRPAEELSSAIHVLARTVS